LAYIGKTPTPAPLTSSDITNGIVTGEKLNADVISSQTELATAPADTDEFLISDAGVLKRLDASLVGGGKIGQVVSTTKTDTFSETVGSGTFSSLITGLTVNITPSATTSKILIFVNMVLGSNGEHALAFAPFRDTTQIDIADASSNKSRFSKGKQANYFGTNGMVNLNTNFLDTPSTTSQITYGVKIQHSSGSSKALYVNRSHNDTDLATYGRSTSTITVIEVLA
tara:strand:+ start:35 stop:712 length:678 start_codon:yes stop_codon:yes gene_type:complete